MVVGYVVVLRDDDEEREKATVLRAFPTVDRLVVDHVDAVGPDITSTLADLLGSLREGEVLVVRSLSRITVSLDGLAEMSAGLVANGVHLVALEQGLDSRTVQGRAVLSTLATLADMTD